MWSIRSNIPLTFHDGLTSRYMSALSTFSQRKLLREGPDKEITGESAEIGYSPWLRDYPPAAPPRSGLLSGTTGTVAGGAVLGIGRLSPGS